MMSNSLSKVSIGINGSMLDDEPTGVGVYSFNVINNLAQLYKEANSSISVFTPTYKKLGLDIEVIKLSDLMQSSKHGKKAALLRFIWNTVIYPIQSKKFDYLISPTTHGSFFSKNQVITIHDVLSLKYNKTLPHQRFYFKFLLPQLIAKSKAIIAISQSTKTDIVNLLNCPEEKIHVIHNGYDPHRYNISENNDDAFCKEYGFKNYFLAVGPNYPHKNFEFLLNVYNKLSFEVKEQFPLVIAGGKQPYLNAIKQFSAKLNLQKHVHFVGYVSEDLMPAMYREAFALIFASLDEGFGMPPLEAMACGCPVIASNSSSIPEVCGEAVLYIDPTKESSLTEAIHQLTRNKALYNELREKGVRQAQKFSWRKTAESLKSLLDDKIFNT